jgi:WD40 repeat protein/DNA-binding winged helix-turn-helix (wHTH) protein
MNRKTESFYEFAGFRLDVAKRILIRQGQPLALAPKVFDTLLFLVQNSGRILEKDELMKAIWPESFVEEGNLSQNIFVLRKILGDDRNGNSLIQTIPRRGYKFVATVKQIDAVVPENGDLGSSQSSLIADYWNCHSPFRSLQVFEPEDAWLFFGRDSEIGELLERLGRSPVLAVIGNSGSGKSSLIRAGLIPALQAGRFCQEGTPVKSWRGAVFRPSGAPFDYLAEVLPSQLAPELSLKEKAEFVADCRNKFPMDKDALRNAVSALINANANVTPERDKAEQIHVMLVADQFEEIFTLTSKRETRDRYIDALLAASRLGGAVAVHVVLALRADFYAQCLEHAGLSRCLQTNLYNVPRMSREQLRESMEPRLQLAAAQAESGLIDSLLEEVGTEPGNLALLEHALGQLWDKCGSYGCTLTNQAYAEIGRLRGALGRHADEVYSSLGDNRLKELAQKIFLELVHLGEDAGNSNDTRRRVSKTGLLSLGDPEEVEQLLARLASSRLIATGGSEQETFVEVSHEALIREWPTLREWITAQRDSLRLERRLRQAAQEWEDVKRDPGALLQGARLAQAEEWLAKSLQPPSSVRDFVLASVEARGEAAQKKLARSRWFSCALALLLILAMGMAWYTYRLQLREKSRALAAQAEEMRDRDQGQALDLAIHGWQTAKTDEARLAVTKTFPQLLATLNHSAGVESAVFSPDGQRVLTASDDHTARVWSSKTGRLLTTLLGHTDKIIYAEFSADSKRIVTASFDHTGRVWNAGDGTLVAILQGHTDKLMRAHFSPDGERIATASWDHTARVWNSTDGHLLAVLRGHQNTIEKAVFSPDGQRILTASWDHTARVWSAANYTLITTLIGHTNALIGASFSSDSQRIVTWGMDDTARVWNSADGRSLAILRHDGRVPRATFSPDGRRIATASFDLTARVWDSENGRLLATLRGHTRAIWHVTFSPDGRLLLTDSEDSTARVWNSIDGRPLLTLQSPASGIPSPHNATTVPYFSAFSPDGRLVVASLGDPTAHVWNIAATGYVVSVLRGHAGELWGPALSPGGEHILTTGRDNTTRLWNSADGRLLQILPSCLPRFSYFSPDGRRIATACNQLARIWNSADGRSLATLAHTGTISGFQFSPDGQLVVTASEDHTARLWSSADGRLLATLAHNDRVGSAQFSPDGQRIVTASEDHTARLWSSVDGRLLATLAHNDRVGSAQFSPDGQRIVTASEDHTARLWSSVDGRLLATLGHDDKVFNAQFSPDGQRIVTESEDHTARVWSSTDGHLLATIPETTAFWGDKFSPDSQSIVTASKDNTARMWSSTDGHLLTTLEGHQDKVLGVQFSTNGQRIVTASQDRTARVWGSTDGGLLATLQGHTNLVVNAVFSLDGQSIVTVSFDQTARVWRVLTLDDIEQILAK